MEPDTSNVDFENLTESKMDKFIKGNLKKLLKREDEIREWISRFFSDKWYNEELERIKEFEKLSEDIEGFEDDVEIKESFDFMSIDGEVTEVIKEAPDVDKNKIKISIQKVIPKYSDKAKKLLEDARENLKFLDLMGIKKKKEVLNVITDKFESYWTFLAYLRSGYSEIFKVIRLFDYSITIKHVMTTIVMVLYDIDEQRWFYDRIYGHKKVLKLLEGKL